MVWNVQEETSQKRCCLCPDSDSIEIHNFTIIGNPIVEIRPPLNRLISVIGFSILALQWRHNGRDGISNHQPHDCLLNRLFKAQIKVDIKAPRRLLCAGSSPVKSPHKGPVTRKMFPFDVVIMVRLYLYIEPTPLFLHRRGRGNHGISDV